MYNFKLSTSFTVKMQENKLIEHSLPVNAWLGALAITTGENLSNSSEMRS